jgi:GTP-binding protein Era
MDQATPTRCGFVALAGRPNVGKSTLLNRVLGQKIAITSNRPQTTRNRIPGVLTRAHDQIIFVDTPGIHQSSRALNAYMVDIAEEAVTDADAVALLVEAGVGPGGEVGVSEIDRAIVEKMNALGRPLFLVLNKIDRLPKPQLLPIIERWSDVGEFAAIVPISARDGDGVEQLVDALAGTLPAGPHLYPEDALTDLPERFIAAEIVREKLFRSLDRELPYSIGVTVESWKDRAGDGIVEIDCVIHVERDSQKAIVIGKSGQNLKRVGAQARTELERLLAARVMLRTFVRVEKGWTRSARGLRKLGYE